MVIINAVGAALLPQCELFQPPIHSSEGDFRSSHRA